MAVDMTLVRPGILPPIIRTTPKFPTIFAKPKTAPDRTPGLASGKATLQKAFHGEARNVAAASSGLSPMAAKALRIGWTTTGSAETMTFAEWIDFEAARIVRMGFATPASFASSPEH